MAINKPHVYPPVVCDKSASRGAFITHNGRINMGFVDGHIESWKNEKVLQAQRGRFEDKYFDPYFRQR